MISLVSIICFLIFTIMLLTLLRKDTDIFSPSRLFILVWTLAIGLTDLKLSGHQLTWSAYSWIMLSISILAALTGMFIVYVVNLEKSVLPVHSARTILMNSRINIELLFLITILLFTAYIISYIVSYLVIGFLPLFTRFPGLSRIDWGIFGFGLFIQAFPSIIYLGILYLTLE